MIKNKQIVRLSFIGLFLAVLFNVLLYRYLLIEELILRQVSNYNNNVVLMYQKTIWNRYISEINNEHLSCSKNSTNQKYKEFVKESIDFFRTLKINFKIFNKNSTELVSHIDSKILISDDDKDRPLRNEIISRIDKYFLQNYSVDQPLKGAMLGKDKHILLSNQGDDSSNNLSYVVSYIPITNASENNFSVEGVVQIITDITSEWNNIAYLEGRILITFLIIFLIFFSIIVYNTNKAQDIISKQFTTNQELKNAKKRIEMESLEKTDFLANVSHELRTPLNCIIGFSEIILAQKVSDNKYYDYVKDINQSGSHLLSVINDILDLSKVRSGKLKIDMVEMNLNKLITAVIRLLTPKAMSARVKLIELKQDETIIVISDPKRLRQGMINVISNAIKFSNADSIVNILLKIDKQRKIVHIIISDTGVGMKEGDIPKALSSFEQIDNTLSKRYDGTGVGLPLTKKLIEHMGGNFTLKSKINEGTIATISLPYSDVLPLSSKFDY